MSTHIHLLPQEPPVPWNLFKKKYPARSIAIDGFVSHGPAFYAPRLMANFNHHEGVDRSATRCTASQIQLAIRQGLFEAYRNKGEIDLHVYANDVDEDCILSIFQLAHPYLSQQVHHAKFNRLIAVEDFLDTTAGAYPFHKDLPFLREVAWIFEPYRRARVTGILNRKHSDEFMGIYTDSEKRILAYLHDKGEQIAHFDTTYEVIGGGKGWNMVKEIGPYARTGMVSDGIQCFISATPRGNGRWNYVIGKTSPYLFHFDVPFLLQALDEEEQKEGVAGDHWGGSTTIGGSPRVHGSRFTPDDVQRLVNEWMGKNETPH